LRLPRTVLILAVVRHVPVTGEASGPGRENVLVENLECTSASAEPYLGSDRSG